MWQTVGHSKVVGQIQRSLENSTFPHAYLIAGPPHVGKMTLALNLAQALNCPAEARPCGDCEPCRKIAAGKHADVQVIGLESGGSVTEIGIDQIRQVQHAANLPPFEGRHRVFILDNAELLSTEAANSLLKTLEEPPAGVVFILLAVATEKLLPTVISRCRLLTLYPVASPQVAEALTARCGIAAERADFLARLSRGRPGWAVAAATDESLLQKRTERVTKLLDVIGGDYEQRFGDAAQLATRFGQDRGEVFETLALWRDWWRDVMLAKLDCPEAVIGTDYLEKLETLASKYTIPQIREALASIQQAENQLRLNANARLVFEVLMLNIPSGGSA